MNKFKQHILMAAMIFAVALVSESCSDEPVSEINKGETTLKASTSLVGGTGGDDFRIAVPCDRALESITVIHGEDIDGLSVSYSDENGNTQIESAGGTNAETSFISLAYFDYVEWIEVFYGGTYKGHVCINALRIKISGRPAQTFGTTGKAPNATTWRFNNGNRRFTGFTGQAGEVIDRLGALYCN